ncbi:hypothetical protein PQX77_002532, partial [Marasmius sp. AFHP31]
EKRRKEGNTAKLRRRDKDAFTEDLWCEPVKSYHKILRRADWAKWRLFDSAARAFLPEQQDGSDVGVHSAGSDEDDAGEILLSEA